MLKLFCGLFLYLMVATCYAGDTIYVDLAAKGLNNGTSWNNAFTLLEVALDVAEDYDQIWVTKGEYKGVLGSYQIRKSLNLIGGFDGTESSITARDTALNKTILLPVYPNIMYIDTLCKDVTIDAFTFKDGDCRLPGFAIDETWCNENPFFERACLGSALYVKRVLKDKPFDLNLKNCTFFNNYSVYGGAIFLYIYQGSGQIFIDNCYFANNIGDVSTGAVTINFGSDVNYLTKIKNCKFISNLGFNFCGALEYYCPFSKPELEISNCLFENNVSFIGASGAFYQYNENPNGASINNCIFKNNSAGNNKLFSGRGGAVFSTNGNFKSCRFESNKSYIGAAVKSFESDFINCSFINNKAGFKAGAIDISKAGANAGKTTNIENCTFVNNTTDSIAAAINLENNKSAIIRNSIFINNNAKENNNVAFVSSKSHLIVDHVFVDSLSFDNFINYEANIQEDTLYIDSSTVYIGVPLFYDTAAFDLRIAACSPAVDKGIITPNSSLLAYDLSGNPRITNGLIDIGAFEALNFADFDTIIVDAGSPTSPNGTIEIQNITGGKPPLAFEWNFGGVGDSLLYNLLPGIYELTITDFFNCSDHAIFTVGSTNSTTSLNPKFINFSLYPNPTHQETCVLEFDSGLSHPQDYEVIITNIYGSQVYQSSIPAYSYIHRMDLSALAAGVYFCNIVLEGKVLGIQKLVVQ